MSHTETLRAALDGVMRYLDGYPTLCGHKLNCPCALRAARAVLAATEPEGSAQSNADAQPVNENVSRLLDDNLYNFFKEKPPTKRQAKRNAAHAALAATVEPEQSTDPVAEWKSHYEEACEAYNYKTKECDDLAAQLAAMTLERDRYKTAYIAAINVWKSCDAIAATKGEAK